MATHVVLEVSSTFNTYAELKEAIERFEKGSHVQLYVRSSRGLEVQRRRAPRKTFKDELEFGEIDYACIHGGRRFKSRSTGQRPNHSTFQMECPFLIRVRVSQDGQKLFVKDLCGEHNHEVSETFFNHLPQQRKMNAEEKELSRSLLKLKADKKLVQQHIRAESGKAVSLKDLNNVMGSSRSAVGLNLQDVSELQKSEGSVTELLERNCILGGIFYKRKNWRQTYARYPELGLIDATYKFNSFEQELERRASNVFHKVSVGMYGGSTQLTEYQRYLTPYAFSFVNKQHKFSTSINIPPDSPTTISLQSSEGKLEVTTEKCSCCFFKAMGLPCRHILAVRRSHHLPLFSAALCAHRWSRDFYKGQRVQAASPALSLFDSSAPQPTAIPSQHQRYRMAFQVAQRLSSLASELPLHEFQQALKLLEKVATAWEGGNGVTVQVVENSTASDSAAVQPQETFGVQTSDSSQLTGEESANSEQGPETEGNDLAESHTSMTGEGDHTQTSGISTSLSSCVCSLSHSHQSSAVEEAAPSQPNTIMCRGVPMDIRLPAKAPTRSRPKRAGSTLISLPVKQKKQAEGLVPFVHKTCVQKK